QLNLISGIFSSDPDTGDTGNTDPDTGDTSSSVVYLADESITAFSVSSQYSIPLKNVYFAYSSLTVSTGDSDLISIGYGALEQYDITVSKDDFRDYIIPKEVGASFKATDTKKFNIYLTYDTKDSKPYVSTVFARNNEDGTTNAYSEVQKTALTVVDGSKQDVIISANLAGASSATYYFSQDSSHRISNTTGVFTAVDLYSRFEKNSPVYAYVITSDGAVSEAVELKLEVKTIDSDTLDFLNESAIDLIGSSGQGITLGDSVPLIGGANLGLDLVEFPLGVSYDASTGIVKLSFGMDIFESESSMGSIERINNWKSFKDAVKTCVKSVKGSVNKLEQYNLSSIINLLRRLAISTES
ncbi:MAG: hypothetical protein LUG95_01155, partial [Clostridiales bacterium]|nr:hypothetical protein [Clostridiales bacterium]